VNQVSTVGLDLAKYIFQLHGAGRAGAVVFRQKLRRAQVLSFLATLPPCAGRPRPSSRPGIFEPFSGNLCIDLQRADLISSVKPQSRN
jgi:hypothetical protein